MAQNKNSFIEKLVDPQMAVLKNAFEKWGVDYSITSEIDPHTKRKITKIHVSRYGKGGKVVDGTNIFKDGPKLSMNIKCSAKKSVKVTVNSIPELLQKYTVLTGKQITDIDRFVQDIALIENKPDVTPDYSHFDNVDQIKKAIQQRTKRSFKTQIVDGELIYNIGSQAKFGIYPIKDGKLRVDIYKWAPSKDGCGFTTIYDLSFIVSSEKVVLLFIDTMISTKEIDHNELLNTYADTAAGQVFDSHLKYDGEMPLSSNRKTLNKTTKTTKPRKTRTKKAKAPVKEPEVVEEEPVNEDTEEQEEIPETPIIKEALPEPEPEPEEIEDEDETIEFESPNAGDVDLEDEDDENNSDDEDNDDEQFSDAAIL